MEPQNEFFLFLHDTAGNLIAKNGNLYIIPRQIVAESPIGNVPEFGKLVDAFSQMVGWKLFHVQEKYVLMECEVFTCKSRAFARAEELGSGVFQY